MRIFIIWFFSSFSDVSQFSLICHCYLRDFFQKAKSALSFSRTTKKFSHIISRYFIKIKEVKRSLREPSFWIFSRVMKIFLNNKKYCPRGLHVCTDGDTKSPSAVGEDKFAMLVKVFFSVIFFFILKWLLWRFCKSFVLTVVPLLSMRELRKCLIFWKKYWAS